MEENKVYSAKVAENYSVAKDVCSMTLNVGGDYPAPTPGQFFNVHLNDKSRLLPRPFCFGGYENGIITLVYAVVGGGTSAMTAMKTGESLRVSSPLGNGFDAGNRGKIYLVGGGLGIAPLIFAAKRLANRDICAVLGFRDAPFLLDRFNCETHVATDSGNFGFFKGNAVGLLKTRNIAKDALIMACGPVPMLKSLQMSFTANPLQLSLESRMGCGYGACVGCVVDTADGHKKVCADGPVFDGKGVIFNG